MAQKKIHDAPKQLKSSVWKHFGFYEQTNSTELDKANAICKVCKVPLVYRTGTTSNLNKHLETRHPHLLKSDEGKRKATNDEASTSKATDSTSSKSKKQKRRTKCF